MATDKANDAADGERAGGKRQRLPPAARREHIIREAIRYFAEVGFDGSTRELAARIGVKQPLLYRYFPSKEDLIREVYETVYLGLWRRDWAREFADRNVPIRDRLIRFYRGYADFQFDRTWIRIYLLSGLKGLDINKRYVAFMEENVLRRICEEIRIAFGLPSSEQIPIQAAELAAFWVFHGGIFYYAVRREIYGVSVHVDVDRFTELSVDSLLGGFPPLVRRILAEQAGSPPIAAASTG